MMRQPSTNRRCGMTLVELVCVMAAASIVTTVTIAALVGAMRADRKLTGRGNFVDARLRLGEQLRSDIHAAERGAWDAEAARLTLELPEGGVVQYDAVDECWERRVSGDEGEPQLAGAFAHVGQADVVVAPAEATVGELLTIRITAHPPSDDNRDLERLPWEIVAAVGRDRELLNK